MLGNEGTCAYLEGTWGGPGHLVRAMRVLGAYLSVVFGNFLKVKVFQNTFGRIPRRESFDADACVEKFPPLPPWTP